MRDVIITTQTKLIMLRVCVFAESVHPADGG
jgi:hypothetical protein